MLMRVIDKDGNILAEYERPHLTKAFVPTARRVSNGVSAKAKPCGVVMSTKDFLNLRK